MRGYGRIGRLGAVHGFVSFFFANMAHNVWTIFAKMTLLTTAIALGWTLYRAINGQVVRTTTRIAQFSVLGTLANEVPYISTVVALFLLRLQIAFRCNMAFLSAVETSLIQMGIWAIFCNVSWSATSVAASVPRATAKAHFRAWVPWWWVHVVRIRGVTKASTSHHHRAIFLNVARSATHVAALQPGFFTVTRKVTMLATIKTSLIGSYGPVPP